MRWTCSRCGPTTAHRNLTPILRDGRLDADLAALDGVRVFAPDGTAIGHIQLPERCANVCFGGRHRNRPFMAATHSVYALYVNTEGA